MGGFSADWLALREPADARARSAALTSAIADRLEAAASPHVLDLAAGTGANARYLDGFLRGDRRSRRWLLVDNDPGAAGESGRAAGAARRHRDACGRSVSSFRARRGQSVRGPGSRDGVRAARSRVGALAERAGRPMRRRRRGRAVRADLQRRHPLLARRAGRRDGPRSGEPAPADRQGIRPGARAGCGGVRRARVYRASVTTCVRSAATGSSPKTCPSCSGSSSRVGPMRPRRSRLTKHRGCTAGEPAGSRTSALDDRASSSATTTWRAWCVR